MSNVFWFCSLMFRLNEDNYFLLFLGLSLSLMMAMTAITIQTIWSVKENQAFFGKRPMAIRAPARKLRIW